MTILQLASQTATSGSAPITVMCSAGQAGVPGTQVYAEHRKCKDEAKKYLALG